jgi:CheY-like chemotaxis protein
LCGCEQLPSGETPPKSRDRSCAPLADIIAGPHCRYTIRPASIGTPSHGAVIDAAFDQLGASFIDRRAVNPSSTEPVHGAQLTQPEESACRVLLVEDEAMIAMLMEDMLAEFGCEIVAIAGQIGEALTVAHSGDFDIAFLDVNLRGESVYPVAEVLQARAIPFAFVTGYGSAGVDAAHNDVPVLQKPFQARELEGVLHRLQAGLRRADT